MIKGKNAIQSLRELFKKVLNKKEKDFRLERRDIKDVLSHIEKKAKIKISNNTKKQILDEADAMNQIGTDIGANWVALRILQVKEINHLRLTQELADSATTGLEKKAALKNLDIAWKRWKEISTPLDKIRIFLPVITGKNSMHFYKWEKHDVLQINKFGMIEPFKSFQFLTIPIIIFTYY